MSCEGCTFDRNLCVAKEVIEANPGNIYREAVKRQKLAQLSATEVVYQKLTPDCDGVREDGSCGVENDVNKVAGYLFGNPSVEIIAREEHQIGFNQ